MGSFTPSGVAATEGFSGIATERSAAELLDPAAPVYFGVLLTVLDGAVLTAAGNGLAGREADALCLALGEVKYV